MPDSAKTSVLHPAALKWILALGGLFVLILVAARLSDFVEFAQALLGHAPFVLVEPGILADSAIVAMLVLAPLVFVLPRTWRAGAGAVLILGTLIALAIGGNATARGGSGLSHTPLSHLLQSRGYTRCPAGDKIRGSGRVTRGEYVAEAWTQPGACPVPVNTSSDTQ